MDLGEDEGKMRAGDVLLRAVAQLRTRSADRCYYNKPRVFITIVTEARHPTYSLLRVSF
jgi:hypothetical protein